MLIALLQSGVLSIMQLIVFTVHWCVCLALLRVVWVAALLRVSRWRECLCAVLELHATISI
jgi:hypothetical protein